MLFYVLYFILCSFCAICNNITECEKNRINQGCCFNYFKNEKGKCVECEKGWFGNNCNQSCPDGYYGHLCLKKCPCPNSSCDKVKGCVVEKSTITPAEEDSSWMMVTFILIGSLSTIAIIACFVYLKSFIRNRKRPISNNRYTANLETIQDEEEPTIRENNIRDSTTENHYTDLRYSTFDFDDCRGACGGEEAPHFSSQKCDTYFSSETKTESHNVYEELKGTDNYNILSLRKNVIKETNANDAKKKTVTCMSPIYGLNEDQIKIHTLPSTLHLKDKEDISYARESQTLPNTAISDKNRNLGTEKETFSIDEISPLPRLRNDDQAKQSEQWGTSNSHGVVPLPRSHGPNENEIPTDKYNVHEGQEDVDLPRANLSSKEENVLLKQTICGEQKEAQHFKMHLQTTENSNNDQGNIHGIQEKTPHSERNSANEEQNPDGMPSVCDVQNPILGQRMHSYTDAVNTMDNRNDVINVQDENAPLIRTPSTSKEQDEDGQDRPYSLAIYSVPCKANNNSEEKQTECTLNPSRPYSKVIKRDVDQTDESPLDDLYYEKSKLIPSNTEIIQENNSENSSSEENDYDN